MNLVMCEGPNELAVMDILLDHDLLTFSRDNLLNLSAFHARQIDKSTVVQIALNLYPGPVDVLRIGDTLTDKLRCPSQYADKINSVKKYCTKPEIEILLILAEGLEDEFAKVKSGKKKRSAKDFSKEHIFAGRKRYDNSTRFYMDYFGSRPDDLAQAIIRYKQIQGAHILKEPFQPPTTFLMYCSIRSAPACFISSVT